MFIFKTKAFSRWQNKEFITDNQLIKAVIEIKNNSIDADLGSGLIKKRISKQGMGKSSGYRTFIAVNRNERLFFIYGFAKNEKDNICKQEEKALKRLASDLLALSDATLNKAIEGGIIKEIVYE